MYLRLIFLPFFVLFLSLVESKSAYIIFSNRREIGKVDLNNNNYTTLVSGLRSATFLDFYHEQSLIYWTDSFKDKIYRGKLFSNNIRDIETVVAGGIGTTQGLAVDWVGQNIYWIESDLYQIEVAKLDGSLRTVLIAGNMSNPRAITLDPREGALFWSDWSSKFPRIETSSMAGENRRMIFNISTVIGGGWVNGLTIDYDQKRLYWVDSRSDTIHSVDYKGQDHLLILEQNSRLRHPFAITLYENFVYWTDWKTNSLMKVNKFNGTNAAQIRRTLLQPYDLKVYHKSRQPVSSNPCYHNGGCTHLCLIGYNSMAKCLNPKSFSPDEKNYDEQSTKDKSTIDGPMTSHATQQTSTTTQDSTLNNKNSTEKDKPKSNPSEISIGIGALYVTIAFVLLFVVIFSFIIIGNRYRNSHGPTDGSATFSLLKKQSE